MSNNYLTEDPQQTVYRDTFVGPEPGSEVGGPALTDLVVEIRRAVEGLHHLYGQARSQLRERIQTERVGFNTDASGNAIVSLFQVPDGATGYLMLCSLEERGKTPASPDTSAELWHGIYGLASAGQGITTVPFGGMLDCSPLTPAADAQIPYVYTYGDRHGAPTLTGPGTFYFVVQGATASVQGSVRAQVLVCHPVH